MIENIAKKVTILFVKNGLVKEEKQHIYMYGAELLISGLASTITILILGLLLQRLVETLLLMLPFYFMRVYAGGYHAETYKNCYLSFCIGFIVILLSTGFIIKYQQDHIIMYFAFAAAAIIFVIAPIEDHSRPLTVNERVKYNKMVKVPVSLFLLISEIMYWKYNWHEMVYITMAIISVCIVLGIGIIKNKIIGFDSNKIQNVLN